MEELFVIQNEFCKQNYPEYQIQATIAWIEAGMSLKKLPAEKVWTKRQIPPATWLHFYKVILNQNRALLFETNSFS